MVFCSGGIFPGIQRNLTDRFIIGVLQRHESLAANLGAKLVGPLLLKSFEVSELLLRVPPCKTMSLSRCRFS